MVTSLRQRGSWSWLTNADHGVEVLSVVAKHVICLLQPVSKHLRHFDETDKLLASASHDLSSSPHLTGRSICEWTTCILLGDYFFDLSKATGKHYSLYNRAISRAGLLVRWIQRANPQAAYLKSVALTATGIFADAAVGCQLHEPLKARQIRIMIETRIQSSFKMTLQ